MIFRFIGRLTFAAGYMVMWSVIGSLFLLGVWAFGYALWWLVNFLTFATS